jgi:hypothetical protein
MNAKEEVLKMLTHQLEFHNKCMELCDNNGAKEIYIKGAEHIQQLITATENAIFDVPSEEEIAWEILAQCNCQYDEIIYRNAIKFILNYKKTETV